MICFIACFVKHRCAPQGSEHRFLTIQRVDWNFALPYLYSEKTRQFHRLCRTDNCSIDIVDSKSCLADVSSPQINVAELRATQISSRKTGLHKDAIVQSRVPKIGIKKLARLK